MSTPLYDLVTLYYRALVGNHADQSRGIYTLPVGRRGIVTHGYVCVEGPAAALNSYGLYLNSGGGQIVAIAENLVAGGTMVLGFDDYEQLSGAFDLRSFNATGAVVLLTGFAQIKVFR